MGGLSALHARPIASLETCRASWETNHDVTAQVLSLCIIAGLIISYLPQHYRIIHARSSEGFSPFFLLLGATSSASSLLNIVTLQWGQVECCQYLSAGQCFESVLGIAQVFFQWACFNTIFILYLVFYPRAAKFVRTLPLEESAIPPLRPFNVLPTLAFLRAPAPATPSRRHSTSSSVSSDFDPSAILLPGQLSRASSIQLSKEYRLALTLFLATLLHLFLTGLTTFILLLTLPGRTPMDVPFDGVGSEGREHPSERAVRVWATTLGVASVLLGCAQYAPQLMLTARRQLVGSLSIPMMCLQVPGSFVFVYTLAVRPGVNWTGWGTYLVTGVLQGALLTMCLLWRSRQRRLGIDDWGRKLDSHGEEVDEVPGERTRLIE